MMYRYLGGSGTKVSSICLGTKTFGEHPGFAGNCNEATAHGILDRFVELGGNFIDTSNNYGSGTAETIVGNWLAKSRNRREMIISSKVMMQVDEANLNSGGLSRSSIIYNVEQSLKRLGTDYIDLYQIHSWDWGTPLEETLRTLDDLVRAGKVRYVGASNVYSWQLQKIIDYNKFMGFTKWVTLQTQYNLLVRDPESDYQSICEMEGLGLLPWSPLKGGWLSGKVTRGAKSAPEGSRIAWAERMAGKIQLQTSPRFSLYAEDETVWNLLNTLEDISRETGKTVAQVAIRWLLQKKMVSSVVTGCRSITQLEDNMGAAGSWELSEEQMSILDAATAVSVPPVAVVMSNMNAKRTRMNWSQ